MVRTKHTAQDNMNTSFFHYDPSLAVAIVAAVLYTLAFLLTVAQCIRYRACVWSIMVIAAASTCAPDRSSLQANL